MFKKILITTALLFLSYNTYANNIVLQKDFSTFDDCNNYFESYNTDDFSMYAEGWFSQFGSPFTSGNAVQNGSQVTLTFGNGGGCSLVNTALWPQAQQEILAEQEDLNNSNGDSQRMPVHFTVTCQGTVLPDSTPEHPHYDWSQDFSQNCTLSTN